ncbi:MAG: hypothetical protein ACK4FK_14925 [Ferrovibrio sp.]|uniref:hypothetical protein n=1 Tax=Ferrovibrio sp. TaxID=1917215 RepID=UPI003919926B
MADLSGAGLAVLVAARQTAGMTRASLSLVLGGPALAAILAGCSGPVSEPYYLGRFRQEDVGIYQQGFLRWANDPATGRPFFSICYNSTLHTAEQVRALVQKHCSDPQLKWNVTDLFSCSLSAPVRVTYSCGSLSRTAEEARPNLRSSDNYTGEISLY